METSRSWQTTPAHHAKPWSSKLDGHEIFIVGMVEARQDITLNEMLSCLQSEQSVGIGRNMLS
ncbi:hypothetical protein GOB93_19580 [Acetobacter musti]|uniref:CobW C-terminal domain-containing protein n=1 Tax=Acetobacter musti TaxID=864732 RepID=A0ABX0JYA7_9PROT|nr:hypothetical protein [Acetobacter musti]NHN86797.1 hypothetical protein [Acetobacter musti]